MRTVVYIFLLLATLLPFSASADFQAGSKSVGFSIDGNIDISGHYFISDNWAWLVGAGFDRYKYSNNDSTYWASSDQKSYSVTTGIKYYFYKGEINLFWEGNLSYYYSRYKRTYDSTGAEPYSDKGTSRGRSVGLNIGLEHFFSKRLSLSGTVGMNYYHERTEAGVYYSGEIKQEGFRTLQTALKVNYYFM